MRGRTGLLVLLATAGCVMPPVRRPAERAPPAARPSPPDCDAATGACGGEPAVPTPTPTLAAAIATTPSLSHFRALAMAGELPAILGRAGRATVIAPTDDAFARLAPGVFEALLLPGNRPSLRHLLRYWIVPGSLSRGSLAERATAGTPVPTFDGEPLRLMPATALPTFVDAARRRATVIGETEGTDGDLVLVDGIVAPRSIEPETPAP